MHRRHFVGTTLACGFGALLGPAAAPSRAVPQATATFLNPILPGDHPDVGAMRLGEDYYLTHSSSVYAPAFLIWHSRDLVNWEPVCYAIDRNTGASIWAPFLCEHKGTFYIYYSGDGPIRVLHAPSIRGPWSAPIALNIQAIDPSHVVDPASGRRYLHCSGGQMAELTDDGLSVKGELRKVFQAWPIPKEWLVECECLEASKIIYKDGYFYLTVAQGGTSGPSTSHMIVSARSRSVEGPFEYSPYNPIIRTRSRDERWWSQGHGRLVDAPDGSWWLTYHAYENGYQTLGRQTMLMPVEWTGDGWYRVPAGVAPEKAIRMPRGERVAGRLELSDDFQKPQLGLQWQFWRDYDKVRFRTGDGRLVLEAREKALADTPVMACIAGDHAYEAEVDVEVPDGCEAGLVLFYSPERAIGMRIDSRGVGFRGPEANSRGGVLRPARRAVLKVVNNKQDVRLWFQLPGAEWEAVPHGWEVAGLNHNVLGQFNSLRPALYSCGAGKATFRNFRYRAI